MRRAKVRWMGLALGAALPAASGCLDFGADGELSKALEEVEGVEVRPEGTPAAGQPESALPAGPVWLNGAAVVEEPGPEGTWGFGEVSSSQEQAALEWLNYARSAAGLDWVLYDASLGEAAREHARFLALNWSAYASLPSEPSLHSQVPGWPGFTGEHFGDRMEAAGFVGEPLGEVIAQHPEPFVAVTQWVDSLYHRIPLLHPDAERVGFGLDVDAAARRGFAVALLSRRKDASEGLAVAYPPHGAEGVPVSWSGAETPQPPAPPTGYPSGPMFTLAFRGEGALVVTAHALLEEGTAPVPHVQLDPSSDPKLGQHAVVALYAHDPLQPQTTYKVQLKGYFAGQPFSWMSWFRTGAGGVCDPLGPTCPGAQACYLTGDEPLCAWPGTAAVGETCLYSNDCAAGAGCREGRCVALCRLAGGEPDERCASRCAAGHESYYGSDEWGACVPPGCSPWDAKSCGAASCLVDTTVRCGPAGGRPWGAICDSAADCRTSSACAVIGEHSPPRCMPLCDARSLAGSGAFGWPEGELYPCRDFCPDQALRHPELPELGVCSSPAP